MRNIIECNINYILNLIYWNRISYTYQYYIDMNFKANIPFNYLINDKDSVNYNDTFVLYQVYILLQ